MPNDTGIKSYEDWTPPKFLQGEDIDLEQVKLEFYRREKDNAKYRRLNASLNARIDDLTETDGDDDSDEQGEATEKAAPPKSKKQGDGQGPSLNEIRLELALENGLTRNQAMRLRGDTREELEADVEAYMEEHGIKRDVEEAEDKDTSGSTPPPRRQPRRGDVKSGSERDGDDGEPSFYDPAKFVDLV